MVTFEKKRINLKIKMNGEPVSVIAKPVSLLAKNTFQIKLLQTETVTIGSIQNGDAKVNLEALIEKDFFLLAWVWIAIENVEKWERWTDNEKINFLKEWAEADPQEFKEAVEITEKECGRLIEI